MEEIWKDIKGYELRYEVSNLGRVRRKERVISVIGNHGPMQVHYKPHISSPYKERKGYMRLWLVNNNGKRCQKMIHVLVAEAFIPNPDNRPFVDHLNTIRDDNRAENLRWVTSKENANNVSTKKHYSKAKTGVSIPSLWKSVIQYDVQGKKIKEWESMTKAESELGLTKGNISRCCKGKVFVADGFIWLSPNSSIEERLRQIKKSDTRKPVRVSTLDGVSIGIFSSTCEASRDLNVPQGNISKVLKGLRQSAHGMKFEYFSED